MNGRPEQALENMKFDPTIWGFPKIRGALLGVAIIRIVVYWGLYSGPLILGNPYLL